MKYHSTWHKTQLVPGRRGRGVWEVVKRVIRKPPLLCVFFYESYKRGKAAGPEGNEQDVTVQVGWAVGGGDVADDQCGNEE